MYTIILKENDMLNEKHFPVVALLNEAYNSDIIGFIKDLNQGIGTGYNYTTCSFWEELDDYDKVKVARYDGVLSETADDEELCLSMKELRYYLVLLQNRILSVNMELFDKISVILDEYKAIYTVTL